VRPRRAGDLDDCTGAAVQKIEAACTAILADQSHPSEERLKAYVSRARLFDSRAEYDLARADAEAAIQLNSKSVPALLAHSYALERIGKFDAALADLNQAIEIEPKQSDRRLQERHAARAEERLRSSCPGAVEAENPAAFEEHSLRQLRAKG